jgi:hypothetical protein
VSLLTNVDLPVPLGPNKKNEVSGILISRFISIIHANLDLFCVLCNHISTIIILKADNRPMNLAHPETGPFGRLRTGSWQMAKCSWQNAVCPSALFDRLRMTQSRKLAMKQLAVGKRQLAIDYSPLTTHLSPLISHLSSLTTHLSFLTLPEYSSQIFRSKPIIMYFCINIMP